jgi:hypothetical protein
MRRNPLVFDNRFDPETVRRSGSRVVASLTAPPAQRAQVARLADSPHTFRVILLDSAGDYYDNEALATLSQPGCVTLLLSLAEMEDLDLRSRNKRLPKTAGLSRFSAFVLLHRLGDVLYPALEGVVYPHLTISLPRLVQSGWSDSISPDRVYFPGEISTVTRELARRLIEPKRMFRSGDPQDTYNLLRRYIMSHTNSQMSREGLHSDDPYPDDAAQYIADWVALSEMPSARARPGRGEPWLLFPPKPGMYTPDIEEKLQKFSEAINADFPPFIQSLLDDLDGAVIRL